MTSQQVFGQAASDLREDVTDKPALAHEEALEAAELALKVLMIVTVVVVVVQ